jgi:hypothetical protein
VSYLVVTHLDPSASPATERKLAGLGLLRCLVDRRNVPHVLPEGTFAGVFYGDTASALRQRIAHAVRAELGPAVRVAVCVGGDWSLRHAA